MGAEIFHANKERSRWEDKVEEDNSLVLQVFAKTLNNMRNKYVLLANFVQENRARTASFLMIFRLHSVTHHSRYDSSGREIGPSQRPLTDNTQRSQETDNHVTGRIETRKPSP